MATNNPHIAEERNMTVDDSGVDEEDKFVINPFPLPNVLCITSRYGAVVRNNVYIPPGARRQQQNVASASASKSEAPKLATNASDSAPAPTAAQSAVVSKEPTKVRVKIQ
jgi:PAB1-binding protein PBP1